MFSALKLVLFFLQTSMEYYFESVYFINILYETNKKHYVFPHKIERGLSLGHTIMMMFWILLLRCLAHSTYVNLELVASFQRLLLCVYSTTFIKLIQLIPYRMPLFSTELTHATISYPIPPKGRMSGSISLLIDYDVISRSID